MVAEPGTTHGMMTETMSSLGEFEEWIDEARRIADTAPPVTAGATSSDEAMRRINGMFKVMWEKMKGMWAKVTKVNDE